MSIFAPAMGVIWKQLDEHGIDPDPVFRAEGIDPETNLMGSVNAQGLDYFNMPNTRSISARLGITF